MIAAFLALLPTAATSSEPPKMRTAFNCAVQEVAGNPPSKTGAARRLSILLEGTGPYETHKTLDPSRLLDGEEVRQFLVVQNGKDLRLVGLTGNADQPSTWNLVIYQDEVGKVWDIAVGRSGKVEFSGFCAAFKKSTTAHDIESFASKWNAGQ